MVLKKHPFTDKMYDYDYEFYDYEFYDYDYEIHIFKTNFFYIEWIVLVIVACKVPITVTLYECNSS